MDRRGEYMARVVELSRIDIDACGVFLDGVPEEVTQDPGHPWWESEEAALLREALDEAVRVLGDD